MSARNTRSIALAVLFVCTTGLVGIAEADQFDSILIPQNAAPNAAPDFANNIALDLAAQPVTGNSSGAQVQVPLPLYERVLREVRSRTRPDDKRLGPAILLGEASYRGQANATTGALELQASLGVTLGRPGQWKMVPLVGDDVVLAQASVDGKSIPVSTDSGYHVWLTERTGEVTVELQLLIPARGPRGSIEYDFRVARTPVTSFESRFPMAGLEPRLDGAVRSTVEPDGQQTVLRAVVRPTTRIHLVGFRDLGNAENSRANVYAETKNLLSVDENSLELFAVIRYTILYAGAKEFLVHIPKGVKVVSADGRGAFRYTLEEQADGVLLRGETAFPIRDSYEISLRLERDLPKDAEFMFDVPLPRCQGVEREVGWLAVEVPGKTRLETAERAEMLAIDMRQLPPELVRSAVSPILEAYRYHDAAQRSLRLAATRLPEKETASESIDRIRAFSVVSRGGDVLTEMRISLRNRLRHSIALELSATAKVRSVLLDGRPVKPSRDTDDRLMLPLERSSGSLNQLKPITLQVILEDRVSELDSLGRPELTLPAVDLPASSLSWSVFVPASNLYSAPSSDIASQTYYGRASWREPVLTYAADQYDSANNANLFGLNSVLGNANDDGSGLDGPATASAYTGAMPVRIDIPKTGVRLEYKRYWLEPGKPARISFTYLSRWLTHPLIFGFGLVLMLGCWLLNSRTNWRWLAPVLVIAPLWPLVKIAGMSVLIGFCGAGLFVYLWPRIWPPGTAATLERWALGLTGRYRQDRYQIFVARQEALAAQIQGAMPSRGARARQILGRLIIAGALVAVVFLLAEQLGQLYGLLKQPLGG